jgi:hypothetical protein
MSYVSLLKNIPEVLGQPTGIAAMASVGIHGAIALIVPLMPVNSTPSAAADSTKTVGLMELSMADQSRLPQTPNTSLGAVQTSQLPLQPQIPLAKFNSEVAVMPPLQAPLPSQQGLPAIPKSPANYNLSYLPRQQSVSMPKFSRNDFRTQVTNFRPYTPSRSPFVDDIDVKIKESQPLNINRLPQAQASNQVSGEPLLNPSPDAIDIGTTAKSEGVTEPEKIQLGNRPVETAGVSPAEVRGEPSFLGKGQLLSAAPIVVPSVNNSAQQQNQVPITGSSESQSGKSEQLLAKLNSYNNLRKTVQEEYPNIKEQAAIRETISTNKRDIEGTVLGRLVVDPDGKVLDIKFQDGSVATELKSKTRAFFNANPPKGEKRISSYPFQLRFKTNSNSDAPGKTPNLKTSPNTEIQKVSEPQEGKNSRDSKPVVIANPSATPTVGDDQSAVSTESTQKLIKKLRQIKEERQTSDQEN